MAIIGGVNCTGFLLIPVLTCVCLFQELQQAMDKLELNLNKSDQGAGLESKEEEIESPENLAVLRQRKMVQSLIHRWFPKVVRFNRNF